MKNTGLLALSLPLAKTAMASAMAMASHKLPALGIQLYMVKEDMEKDAPGTLKNWVRWAIRKLKALAEVRACFGVWVIRNLPGLLLIMGLLWYPVIITMMPEGFEKQAELAAEIGMKYLICPWKGPQKSIDNFKRFADEFNHNGEICKRHGMRFGYHPHDYPYKKIDGQLPIDVLLAHTDNELVDFQMDFYYTVTEGQNPGEYIRKYPGRFKLCHMRDVLRNACRRVARKSLPAIWGRGSLIIRAFYPRGWIMG